MTDATPTLHSTLRGPLLACAIGLWLALLQFAFFFLLEVRISSRATSFFIALFFWLAGFLVGLNLRSPSAFTRLVLLAPAAYYAAYLLLGALPYRHQLLPAVGVCIATAGALAGSFFPHAATRFPGTKWLLFHENNGFIAGILIALIGSVFAGRFFLEWAPALGALPVAGCVWRNHRQP